MFADEPVYKEYTVTVAEGETLWEIAGRHTEAREDVREVIFRIEQANKLNSKHIYPGQVLKVPLRVHDNADGSGKIDENIKYNKQRNKKAVVPAGWCNSLWCFQ